eukprot:TRINITY_DN8253_c0_g3_i1.p1 TRINITY_DN8253_c0_g3~~TRINITY_DN8253_c0_g3_i1.p1  ORF type:complete len:283 (+),score=44.84 TRINITY_DN8253_c0_g3_i1:139-987(+)
MSPRWDRSQRSHALRIQETARPPMAAFNPMPKTSLRFEAKPFQTQGFQGLQAVTNHALGQCNPCAYYWNKADGCRQGADCSFCHLCDSDAMRRKKRIRRAMVRNGTFPNQVLKKETHKAVSKQPQKVVLSMPLDQVPVYIPADMERVSRSNSSEDLERDPVNSIASVKRIGSTCSESTGVTGVARSNDSNSDDLDTDSPSPSTLMGDDIKYIPLDSLRPSSADETAFAGMPFQSMLGSFGSTEAPYMPEFAPSMLPHMPYTLEPFPTNDGLDNVLSCLRNEE